MAQAIGFKGQGQTTLYNLSGSSSVTNGEQLLVPFHKNGRSYFEFQNTSDTAMRLGIGGATATAALTNGVVTSISVVNGGWNYTYPPLVRLLGGLAQTEGVPQCLGGGLFGQTPVGQSMAVATAVLTGDNVSSITVNSGGSGYTAAPFVYLENDPRDPFGCFLPSATEGVLINPGGSRVLENNFIDTSQISLYCGSSGKTFALFIAP